VFGWLKKTRKKFARAIRARFDSAVTTDANSRHWGNADGLSPDAAMSPGVRRTLRNRTRYEVANNTYAQGIVLTLANDMIGTGPRLQMLTDNDDANKRIEDEWRTWSQAINLGAKLRTLRMARAVDGEGFAILTTNPRDETDITLDVRLVEADRVTTPTLSTLDPNAIDGIRFDPQGNPIEYDVLRYHPGDTTTVGLGTEYDSFPADSVIHYFRADRPEQHRGIPELTPALHLFAQLRRYTLAVLGAAETVADFAGILYTDSPPDGEATSVMPMDSIELEMRSLLTMPEGWKMMQMKAEQPTTTYDMYVRAVLNEIARCLNMPFNVAAGNSSGYNYASGRLDHQTYFKSIRVEQGNFNIQVMNRIHSAFMDEAALIPDLAQGLGSFKSWPHTWFYDGVEHVDPLKEANAQAKRLISSTTTLAAEYARQGMDWETQLRQRAKEIELMEELGLPQPSEGIQGMAEDVEKLTIRLSDDDIETIVENTLEKLNED